VFKSVLHIGKYSRDTDGGLERVMYSQISELRKRGYLVYSLSYDKGALAPENSDGLDFHCRATLMLMNQPVSLDFIFRLLSLSTKVDVIQLHVPNLMASLSVLLASMFSRRLRSMPLVLQWHSDIVGDAAARWFARYLQNILLRRTNLVICSSLIYAQNSPELKKHLGKVRIVRIWSGGPRRPHPTALDPLFEKKIGRIRERGGKIILSVGRLVGYKNQRQLIESFTKLPSNIYLMLVGNGPLLGTLRRGIENLGLEDRVEIITGLSDQELDWMFTKSDVFCLLSSDRRESFGLVFLEALIRGLKVVAFDNHSSGSKELFDIAGAQASLLKSLDPLDVSEALISALNDPWLAQDSSINVKDYYQNNAGVRELMTVYGELGIPLEEGRDGRES